MTEYLLQEQKNVAILNSISEIIVSSDSLFEILEEVRKYIKIVIPCDYVSIILNNDKSRYFFIIPVLFDSDSAIKEEITIHYNESSFTEILRSQKSMNRTDLSIRGALTPGDLKFLEEGIESDLAVPVFHQKRVQAIIHVSSYETQAFNGMHQELLEEIAVFVSLALDRIQLAEEVRNLKDSVSVWKDKYKQILKLSDTPIALVSKDLNLIYDVNEKFEELTGYSAYQLDGMNFNNIHPKIQVHSLNQVVRETNSGIISFIKELSLLRSDGTEVSLDCKIAPFVDSGEPLLMVSYDSTSNEAKKSAIENHANTLPLTRMAILTKENPGDPDMIGDLSFIVRQAGLVSRAKYVVLHSVKNNVVASQILCVRQHPFEEDEDVDMPLCISLSQGPYQAIIDRGTSVFYDDVFNTEEFFEWLTLAQNLGYRAFAAHPLKYKGRIIGLLSIYWGTEKREEYDFSSDLAPITSMLSLILENYRLQNEQCKNESHTKVIKKIASFLSSHGKIDQLFKDIVMLLKDLFEFDIIMLTIFNGSPDHYKTLAIASERYGSLFDVNCWKPFEDSKFGWLFLPENYNNGNGKMNSVNKWSNKLRSNMNTLLMNKSRYVGTLSVSSMEQDTYAANQREFLEQVSDFISYGIQNVHIKNEMEVLEKSFNEIDRICQLINSSIPQQHVMKDLLLNVQPVFGAEICSYAHVIKNVIEHHVYSNDIEESRSDMQRFEERIIIPKILDTKNYVLLTDLKDTAQSLGLLNFKFSSFLAVPLLDDDNLIGILNFYWENPVTIDEYRLKFIKVISNQLSLLRAKEVYKQEFEKADSRVENSKRDLDKLVQSLSHNLKTYIDAIQGFSAIMMNDLRTMLSDENKKYLYRIRDYADRMEFYMRDLLELANIEHVPNKYEEVDAASILDLVMSEYIFDLEKRKIKIELPENLPTLYCDKMRMLTVFKKLIENAIQYSDPTKEQSNIHISYDENNSHITFHIKDDGIGISEEYSADIFTLFYTIENDSMDHNGNGLGLPMVKRIIESHRGTIDVVSKPGVGSTFYFSLPKT